MALTLPTSGDLTPAEQAQAEQLAYSVYTGQRQSGQLNDAGRSLLARYQGYLKTIGFSSFRDYLSARSGQITSATPRAPAPGSVPARPVEPTTAAARESAAAPLSINKLVGAAVAGAKVAGKAVAEGAPSAFRLLQQIAPGNIYDLPFRLGHLLNAQSRDDLIRTVGMASAPLSGLSESLNYLGVGSDKIEQTLMRAKGYPNYETFLEGQGIPTKAASPIAGALRGIIDPSNVLLSSTFLGAIAKLGRLGAGAAAAKIAGGVKKGEDLAAATSRAEAEYARLTIPPKAKTQLAVAAKSPTTTQGMRTQQAILQQTINRRDLTREPQKLLPAPGARFIGTPPVSGPHGTVPGAVMTAEEHTAQAETFATGIEAYKPGYNPDKPWLIETAGANPVYQLRASKTLGIEPPIDLGPAPHVEAIKPIQAAEQLQAQVFADAKAIAASYTAAIDAAAARAALAETNLAVRLKAAGLTLSRRYRRSNLPQTVERYAAGARQVPPNGAEIAQVLDAQHAAQQALDAQSDLMRLEGQQASHVATPAEPGSYTEDEWGNPVIGGGSDAPMRDKRRFSFSQPDEIVLAITRDSTQADKVRKFTQDRYAIEAQYIQALRRAGVYPRTFFRRNGMTAAELENLRAVVSGEAVAMNERVARGAAAVKEIGDRFGKELEDLGATILGKRIIKKGKVYDPNKELKNGKGGWVEDESSAKAVVIERLPFQRIPNRFPIRLSLDRILGLGSREKLIALLKRDNPMVDDAELNDVAAALFNRASGTRPSGLSSTAWEVMQRSTYNTMLHERTAIKLPAEIRMDPYHELLIDARDHANSLAAARHLGPNDETLTNWQKRVDDNYDRHLLETIYRRLRNVDPKDPMDDAHWLVQPLNSFAALTLISFKTTLKHLNRYATGLGDMGLGNMATGFLKAFTLNGKLDAEAAGMYTRNIRDAFVSMYREDPVAKATRAALRLEGLPQMDAFARVTTYHAAKSEINALRAAAASGSKSAAVRLFNKYGIDAIHSTQAEIDRAAGIQATRLSPTPGFAGEFKALQAPQFAFARSLNVFTALYSKMIWREFVTPLVRSRFQSGDAWVNFLRFAAASYAEGEIVSTLFDEINHLVFGINAPGAPGGGPSEFYTKQASDFQQGKVNPAQLAERLAWGIAMAHGIGILSTELLLLTRAGNILPPRQWPATLGRQVTQTMQGATIGRVEELGRGLSAAITAVQKKLAGQPVPNPTARDLVRSIPAVGGAITMPSANYLRSIYATAYWRAISEGDEEQAASWKNEYQRITGHQLSDKLLEETRKEMGLK